jgi:hypothetical protein
MVYSTEYTELQPLLSGVHSVMRVKLVLAGEGGGSPPLITFTLTSKVAVYAPAEWAGTLTLFHLYQYMYSVVYLTSFVHNSPRLPLYKYQGETDSNQFVTMIVMSLYECGNTRENLQDRHLL